jgi:HEAT repeat protein
MTNRTDQGSGGISPIRRFGLDHYGFNTMMTSAWLLGELAPHSQAALPALKDVLAGDHPGWLKVVVARSIWRLEGEADQVLPALRATLNDPGNETRVIACVTLGEMGAAARPAIADLEASCKLSLNTRRAALEAISLIQKE